MVVHAEQERVRLLLKEAIPLLCKNGLTYNKEFCIEALVGITLDQNDVFLVSIKETVKGDIEVNAEQLDTNNEEVRSEEGAVQHHSKEHSPKSKTPRKRTRLSTERSSKDQGHIEIDSEPGAMGETIDVIPMKRERFSSSYEDESIQAQNSRRPSVKCSNSDNEDSDELVVIKCEPPVMGDYSGMAAYGGSNSSFDVGEQVYGNYPGTSDVSSPGLVVSKVSHVGGEGGEGTSEQGPMENMPTYSKNVDYNALDKGRLLSESNKLMVERTVVREDGLSSQIWECVVCHKLSNLKTNLRKHVYAIHFKAERYRCDLCGERFLWNGAYSHHKLYCGHRK